MNPTIFEYRHPDDGYLRLERTLGLVTLTCRWPFDTSRDEWISIRNEFDAVAYDAAIRQLEEKGTGEVAGLVGGSLKINLSGEQVSIDFSNESSGWMHRSLQLLLQIPLHDLELTPSSS